MIPFLDPAVPYLRKPSRMAFTNLSTGLEIENN